MPIIYKDSYKILLKDIYYIPSLQTTLISSKELTNKNWTILFKNNIASLENKKTNISINAIWQYNAYYLDFKLDLDILEKVVYKVETSISNKLDLYYKRLNHINKDYLIKTINSTSSLDLDSSKEELKELSSYNSCYLGKFTQINSKIPLASASKLAILDIDLAGPFRTIGLKGERYFATITDRATRAIWVYPIKFKSDILDILVTLVKQLYTQFSTKVKAFHLDNAKEFKSTKFDLFYTKEGIIREFTSPYSPSQNGIAERLNRYLVERLISIIKEKNIPLFL